MTLLVRDGLGVLAFVGVAVTLGSWLDKSVISVLGDSPIKVICGFGVKLTRF